MRSLYNYVVFSFVAVQELSLLATALQVRVDSRASKSQSSCGEENDPTPNPQPEPTPKPDSTPEPDSTPKPQPEPTPKPDSTTTTDYDKGPRKVYIMRHAESLGNVGSFWKYSHADPPLSCAVDPELKATEMGRKLLSEEYHGREMALAAGKKFAHDVEGSLNVKYHIEPLILFNLHATSIEFLARSRIGVVLVVGSMTMLIKKYELILQVY